MNSEKRSGIIHKIKIDEYDVIIELYRNKLHVYEASTGTFLKKHDLKLRERVVQLIQGWSFLSWQGQKGKNYGVEIGVLDLKHVIQTNDEYIFAIRFKPEINLGGHFGYYGWGLFNIEHDIIRPRFAQSADKLRSGEIYQREKNAIIFLGFENGLIEALELNTAAGLYNFNPKQGKIWEATDEHPLRSLTIINEMLLSTHNDGFVKVRDLATGELRHSIEVFKDKVNCLAYDEKACYVGTWNGMSAAIDLRTWNVLWRTRLGDISLNGCKVINDQVCFVNNEYDVYWVARDTGELHQHIKSQIGVASNPTQLKQWVLIAGAAYVLVFSGDERVEALEWEDDLIRAIQFIPYGLLVGNDSGKLSLWTFPRIKIREE